MNFGRESKPQPSVATGANGGDGVCWAVGAGMAGGSSAATGGGAVASGANSGSAAARAGRVFTIRLDDDGPGDYPSPRDVSGFAESLRRLDKHNDARSASTTLRFQASGGTRSDLEKNARRIISSHYENSPADVRVAYWGVGPARPRGYITRMDGQSTPISWEQEFFAVAVTVPAKGEGAK